jgi:hypothetical protein
MFYYNYHDKLFSTLVLIGIHYTINRRINRLDIKIKDTDNKSNKEFKDEYILSSQ